MTKKLAIILVMLAISAPTDAGAAIDNLEVSGWIPYWRVSQGIKSAKKNLDKLAEINPFSYSAQPDGTIKDLAKMGSSGWKKFIREAQKEKVRVVPTVMWSDGAATHAVLSNQAKRAAHVKAIADLVKEEKYDGIDIDYEAELLATREYFSAFIRELKAALGDKFLSCTIEARTPPDSLYRVVPTKLQYVNDFAVLTRACDRVKIMTYDQRNADIKLNREKGGQPYMPVADRDWVRKVIQLTLKEIPKEKLVIGAATYGHEYEVSTTGKGFAYTRIGAVNPDYAKKTARKYKAKAARNTAGEMGFTYIEGQKNSGTTLAATGTFNLVSWSDAGAVKDKAELAREFSLRGLAIFKIDGGEDPGIWKLFGSAANSRSADDSSSGGGQLQVE